MTDGVTIRKSLTREEWEAISDQFPTEYERIAAAKSDFLMDAEITRGIQVLYKQLSTLYGSSMPARRATTLVNALILIDQQAATVIDQIGETIDELDDDFYSKDDRDSVLATIGTYVKEANACFSSMVAVAKHINVALLQPATCRTYFGLLQNIDIRSAALDMMREMALESLDKMAKRDEEDGKDADDRE